MKRISIILFILMGTINLSLYGQAEIAIGVKGGINFASLSGASNLSTAYSMRTGFHGGAYCMIKLTKIAIQPEILFSQQGTQFTYNSQSLSSNFTYISVPVLVKLYLLLGINVFTGIQLSHVVSSSGDLYNTASGQITSGQDLSSVVHDYDFAVPIGAGIDLPFGLNLSFRYNIGISDVNKLSGNSSTPPANVSLMGTSESKNQVFQLSVGYRLLKLGN